MYTLTNDLWNSIIEEVVDAYAPSFEAMKNAADSIQLSGSLVEELKQYNIPYAPDLNPIEFGWKDFKREIAKYTNFDEAIIAS